MRCGARKKKRRAVVGARLLLDDRLQLVFLPVGEVEPVELGFLAGTGAGRNDADGLLEIVVRGFGLVPRAMVWLVRSGSARQPVQQGLPEAVPEIDARQHDQASGDQ